MLSFADPPAVASWRHEGARAGFEVAFFTVTEDGWRVEGATTATEDGQSWIVQYVILLNRDWLTRSARITSRSRESTLVTAIEADGQGHWRIDGIPAAQLDGCLDLDLEASAMTNTFPVRRLRPGTVGEVAAPAAYVRAVGLTVQRLEQTYARSGEREYDYTAPEFDFTARLVYDPYGLIVDYPGIASRVQ